LEKQINLAFIGDLYSPHNLKWVEKLCEKKDFSVSFIGHFPKDIDLPQNLKIFPLQVGTYSIFNIPNRKNIQKQIKKIILNENIDIVHSLYAVPNSFWMKDIKLAPHIITTRGSDVLVEYEKGFHNVGGILKPLKMFLLRRILKKALLTATIITSTSHRQVEQIKKNH